MSIQRRGLLKSFAGEGMLALAPRFVEADEQVERATRGTPPPRIKDISVIECQPDGVRLTVMRDGYLNGGWGEVGLRDGTVIKQ